MIKLNLKNLILYNEPINFDRRTFIEHLMEHKKLTDNENKSRKASRVNTRIGSRALKKKSTTILNSNDEVINSIKLNLDNINNFSIIDLRDDH